MDLEYKRKRLADVAAGLRESRALAARENWTREQVEADRTARLNELAAYASAHSPFWRERLSGARRADGSLDLAAVPPLRKAEMMERFDDVVTDRRLRRDELLAHVESLSGDELYLGQYRAMTTSGSSGLKGLFVYDRTAWRTITAQFFRYSAFAAITPRLPRRRRVAAIGGGSPAHMSRRLADSVAIGVHRVLSLPVTMALPRIVAELNDFRPDFVNCYPSVAVLLAAEQEAGRLRISPSGISTSSEWRSPEATARIRGAFGVEPVDMYATTEGLWGVTCPEHHALHLFDDTCIVENEGDSLLVTNLYNRAQPLFRFEVGDVTSFAAEPCPCGRPLTVVESIDGRAEDVLRLPGRNGARVPVHAVQFGVVPADRDVREYQIVQSGDRVRVRVVLVPDADAAAATERLGERVRDRLSAAGVDSPAVDIEQVEDALERSPAGKLPIVIAG